ncbi:MAG TPA: ATP-binding protein [Acidimicrobiales bacterium]|nr:ATP-binding protein [Acidimicrobiales bacterium]
MTDVGIFEWPPVASFIDREEHLARLDEWWGGAQELPINLHGRRRTGKSWLFRRFAHGKPAIILVARKAAAGKQLKDFAEQLEGALGIRPDIPDVPTLFRVLLRSARDRRILAVIDEFPYLLPRSKTDTDRVLSAIAAVLEDERDHSLLKLVLSGSTTAVMTSLQQEKNPMYGRLTPLVLRPLEYEKATAFLTTLEPIGRFERYAISGGMPRYLSLLGDGDLRTTICRRILDQNAPLFNEVRTSIEQELIQSGTYFSILEILAGGAKETAEIAAAMQSKLSEVTNYLSTLHDVGLVERENPFGALAGSKSGHWRLTDPFFAFWFRFVYPFQDSLESGLPPFDLFDSEVAPALSQLVSIVFEDWARRWTRMHLGPVATTVGRWWGRSLDSLRKSGERTSEEIDIVGAARSRVNVVGEAKWRAGAMRADVVKELDEFKIPALRQAGFKVSGELKIVLMSKNGYAPGLERLAESDDRLILVDVPAQLAP